VTAKTELELLKEAGERMVQRMKDDPAYAKKFLRQIMGPPKRKLEGSEREHMLTVFNLIDPVESSNNQHVWTDVYAHAGKTYHVHFFDGSDEVEVEEILPDEES